MNFQDLLGIRISRIALGFFAFLATCGPGVLLVFVYDRPLFLSLDLTRLILLSFAITGPLFLINYIALSLIWGGMIVAYPKTFGRPFDAMDQEKAGELRQESNISFGCLGSFLPVYMPLAVRVLTGWGGPRSAIIIAAMVEAIEVVFYFWLAWFFWMGPLFKKHRSTLPPEIKNVLETLTPTMRRKVFRMATFQSVKDIVTGKQVYEEPKTSLLPIGELATPPPPGDATTQQAK